MMFIVKYVNTNWCVLTSTIVGKEMEKSLMIRKTSKSLRISRTTLVKALVRREKNENPNETSFWSFQGRIPRKGKVIVDALRILTKKNWCDNTRAAPNKKDVVKR